MDLGYTVGSELVSIFGSNLGSAVELDFGSTVGSDPEPTAILVLGSTDRTFSPHRMSDWISDLLSDQVSDF